MWASPALLVFLWFWFWRHPSASPDIVQYCRFPAYKPALLIQGPIRARVSSSQAVAQPVRRSSGNSVPSDVRGRALPATSPNWRLGKHLYWQIGDFNSRPGCSSVLACHCGLLAVVVAEPQVWARISRAPRTAGHSWRYTEPSPATTSRKRAPPYRDWLPVHRNPLFVHLRENWGASCSRWKLIQLPSGELGAHHRRHN